MLRGRIFEQQGLFRSFGLRLLHEAIARRKYAGKHPSNSSLRNEAILYV